MDTRPTRLAPAVIRFRLARLPFAYKNALPHSVLVFYFNNNNTI